MSGPVTSAGAVKALIESAGLNLKAERSVVAPQETYPYVSIMERVAFVPDPSSATFDRDIPPGFIETLQVDLWQKWRTATTGSNTRTEDRTLAKRLIRALHGKRVGQIGSANTWGVKVTDARRIPDDDTNIVHDAITITLSQELY